MRFLLILSLCAGAGACSTPLDAPMSQTFGAAVASMQTQIIPATVSDLPPESSGARGAAAIKRYEKGEPKQPQAQGTSDVKLTVVPYGSGK